MYTRNNMCVCVQHPVSSPYSQNIKNLYKIWEDVFYSTNWQKYFALISKLLQLLYMRLCKPFHCMRFEVLKTASINPLNAELNPICHLLALLGVHFLQVSRIRVNSLTLRLLMSYIYGAPILDVSRSHTTTQHSR